MTADNQEGALSLWEPGSGSRRVRHLASLHLRNFKTRVTLDSEDAQELFNISLAIGMPGDGQPPCFLTEPSDPCVNADWEIDPRSFATASSSSTSTSCAQFPGLQSLTISAWARSASTWKPAQDRQWTYCWQRDIHLQELERVPTGLSSPVMRRLPANSLLIGLKSPLCPGLPGPSGKDRRENIARSAAYIASVDSQTGQLEDKQKAENGHSYPMRTAPSSEAITYYLVPLPLVRKPSSRGKRQVSLGGVKKTDEGEDAGGSEPETGGPERDPEEDSDREDGYESETAYELSSSSSPHKSGRPGLEHRTSSGRTLRALRKGRRKKTTSDSFEPSANSDSPARKPGVRRSTETDRESLKPIKLSEEEERKRKVQMWQLEREREREVLERSKRETKMLKSYERDHLEEMVRLQLQNSLESRNLSQIRQECGRKLTAPGEMPTLKRRMSAVRGKLKTLEDTLSSQYEIKRQLRSSITEKREAFARRRARLDLVKRQLHTDEGTLRERQEEPEILSLEVSRQQIILHNRRTQLLDSLSEIYPIRLISPSDLLLSICQIPLPNSPAVALVDSRGKVDEEGIAAALGLTAQLVLLLSAYLDTSLHYEIAAAGSRAMIRDGISLMNGPRGFPLYSKGAEPYRFEYAVFLLNKNVEQLMNVHNLPVLDLRHTLPNLNNLMLTLSSPISLDETSSHLTAMLGRKGISPTSSSRSTTTTLRSVSQPISSLRRSYRTTGKGEIVLPSDPTTGVVGTDSNNGSEEQKGVDAINGIGGQTGAEERMSSGNKGDEMDKSAAASWTASLLGWNGGAVK